MHTQLEHQFTYDLFAHTERLIQSQPRDIRTHCMDTVRSLRLIALTAISTEDRERATELANRLEIASILPLPLWGLTPVSI